MLTQAPSFISYVQSKSLEVAMKSLRHTMLLMMIAVSRAAAQTSAPPSHDSSAHAIYQKFQDLKWEKLIPELGAASAEIAILNVDPKSRATQLMIRSPKNYHAPKHWHTANETHTVISGTFIMQHDGGAREGIGSRLLQSHVEQDDSRGVVKAR